MHHTFGFPVCCKLVFGGRTLIIRSSLDLGLRLSNGKFLDGLRDRSAVELGGDGDGVLLLVADDVVEADLVPKVGMRFLNLH